MCAKADRGHAAVLSNQRQPFGSEIVFTSEETVHMTMAQIQARLATTFDFETVVELSELVEQFTTDVV